MTRSGRFSKGDDGYKVRFERTLPYPIDAVWRALTDPAQMAIWFTDVKMDFVVGGKMTIYFRDEQKTESFGKIVRLEPLRLFEYSWEDELATWELFPQGNSACKLVLTYSKLPETYAISVPAGWHIILDQLEDVLSGHTEPYPFGGEETELAKSMKAFYRDLIVPEFPELKKQML